MFETRGKVREKLLKFTLGPPSVTVKLRVRERQTCTTRLRLHATKRPTTAAHRTDKLLTKPRK
jgi:hypothetical protein